MGNRIAVENRVSRGGSVRAVFSRRCKGYAAPLDLVIAHLKASILWRELWKVGAQNEAMRARVAADFAGYLVTDADDLALITFYQSRWNNGLAFLIQIPKRRLTPILFTSRLDYGLFWFWFDAWLLVRRKIIRQNWVLQNHDF